MVKNYILNESQQKLVEENLPIVDILLRTRIRPNKNIRGMEFDELYQCGCLALCKAAYTYNGSTQFSTYASRVVYNAMIDQCRTAKAQYDRTLSSDASRADEDAYSEVAPAADDVFLAGELAELLREAKRRHSGAVLKGIEAIELQIKGYTGEEIARMYGVQNNNVRNWISMARAVLRKEFA